MFAAWGLAGLALLLVNLALSTSPTAAQPAGNDGDRGIETEHQGSLLTRDQISAMAERFGTDRIVFGPDGELIDLPQLVPGEWSDSLPPTRALAVDSHTGDLLLFGGGAINQVDPTEPGRVKSRASLGAGGVLARGSLDGEGHLFVARTDGKMVYIDYADSRLVGDGRNYRAVVDMDWRANALAGVPFGAPPPSVESRRPAASGRGGATPWSTGPWTTGLSFASLGLSALLFASAAAQALWLIPYSAGGLGRILIGLFAVVAGVRQGYYFFRTVTDSSLPAPDFRDSVVSLVLAILLSAALYALLRPERRRKRKTRAALDGRSARPWAGAGAMCWDEDWSAVRPMVDSLRRQGVRDIHRYCRDHPDWVRDALTTVGVPERDVPLGGRSRIAFAAAVAGFVDGKRRVEVEVSARAADTVPIVTRVSRELTEPKRPAWSRVLAEAETSIRQSPATVRAKTPLRTRARAATPVTHRAPPDGERPPAGPPISPRATPLDAATDEPPRAAPQPVRDWTSDVGEVAQQVARTMPGGKRAAQVIIDVPPGLTAAGDEDLLRDALTSLLAYAVEATGGEGATPVRLLARQEGGKIHFALGREAADGAPGADGTAGNAPQSWQAASTAIDRLGGSLWAETTGSGICRFTMRARAAADTPDPRVPWRIIPSAHRRDG